MKLLAVLASAFVAAATVAWVVSHGRRELIGSLARCPEDDDGVMPADPYLRVTSDVSGIGVSVVDERPADAVWDWRRIV